MTRARLLSVVLAGAAVAVFLLVGLAVWWWRPPAVPLDASPPAPALAFRPADFAALDGWLDDDHAAALAAFRRSCTRLTAVAPGSDLGTPAGIAEDWAPACAAAAVATSPRAYFEAHFRPVAVLVDGLSEGLFTGYYEPVLDGRRARGEGYAVPLYTRPRDLVTADLGAFREDWRGEQLAGRLQGDRLVPYDSRADIEAGSLAGRAEPLVWLRDPVDAFFLQVQGSGRVRLVEGGELRVGFAASNGRPYTAIGRVLVARRALAPEAVSMQSIRAWLAENPSEATEVMRSNARFVFFREVGGDGPTGAGGTVLVAGRSLAIDRAAVPLHVPVWLETTIPSVDGASSRPLRRLVVAQDTGAAIRGGVRGDLFLGGSEEAAAVAGRMAERGRYFLLLPRAVAARLEPAHADHGRARPGS
jgi:membrane-bound lytic murein transglycosylase A